MEIQNSFLSVVQKKGSNEKPIGLLTAYARINPKTVELSPKNSPFGTIVQNGFLVAQANYRDQNTLKDFLIQEMGTSIDDEDSLREFLEGLTGMEGALNPEKFREKLEQLDDFDDFIPTPAKIIHFATEEAILEEKGDIFYAGFFENIGNANLAVHALTILYQARYREAQAANIRNEIESLITSIEVPISLPITNVTTENILLYRYIPDLFHAANEPHLRNSVEQDFYAFLSWYRYPEDIRKILDLTSTEVISDNERTLITLYVQKIEAVQEENFDKLHTITQKIQEIESELL